MLYSKVLDLAVADEERTVYNISYKSARGREGTGADMNTDISQDTLWEQIVVRQGEIFYTKKGLPFTYYTKGGELFASRRERSITRSTFEKAFQKIRKNPQEVSGPKKLNVYGAPYVWAILSAILLTGAEKEE